jgi:ATP-dependent helicase/DNAse subunit B
LPIRNSTNDSQNTDFVCSLPEEELDEFNIHVARHRPEELTKLAKTTKFSRKEIQLIYRGFKQVCRTINSL